MALILGIESTCDETAASVVRDGYDVRSNVVATQIELHAKYRGVVPEIAGHSLRFVESQYQPEASEAQIRNVFPGASQISASPMSLREIFLALARTFRLKA